MNHNLTIASRAAAIVIHNDQLLVMYRKKHNKTYYTFPGGTVETNESEIDAALRELYEETSIIGQNPRLIYELTINNFSVSNHQTTTQKEFFFLTDYVSGQAQLHTKSPEFQKNSEQNYFQPMWIPLSQIQKINLYPPEIAKILVHDLQSGFSFEPKIIVLDHTKV